jgi:hypothetical protein
MNTIKIDINNPCFLAEWKNLQLKEHKALVNTFLKIQQYTWQQLYMVKGLHWEKITSINEDNLYSFRFSQKYRATGYRVNNILIMVNLHVDHDSAYK